jgi:hypothetical protein
MANATGIYLQIFMLLVLPATKIFSAMFNILEFSSPPLEILPFRKNGVFPDTALFAAGPVHYLCATYLYARNKFCSIIFLPNKK